MYLRNILEVDLIYMKTILYDFLKVTSMAQFSLSNVHKRGLKHHHFKVTSFFLLQCAKLCFYVRVIRLEKEI